MSKLNKAIEIEKFLNTKNRPIKPIKEAKYKGTGLDLSPEQFFALLVSLETKPSDLRENILIDLEYKGITLLEKPTDIINYIKGDLERNGMKMTPEVVKKINKLENEILAIAKKHRAPEYPATGLKKYELAYKTKPTLREVKTLIKETD